MASMTVQAMYDYVRAFLDTDAEDLPDTLLSVWLAEGFERCSRVVEPWDFYAATYTWNANAASVPFTGFGGSETVVCESVKSVTAALYPLAFIPYETAVAKYDYPTSPATGNPLEWSTRKSTLYIWPTPSDLPLLTISGYRKPVAPITGDTTVIPDLPDEFHLLVCEWMLARAFERQTDQESAAGKFSGFSAGLDAYRQRYSRPNDGGLQVIGGICSPTGAQLPERLAYTWEY